MTAMIIILQQRILAYLANVTMRQAVTAATTYLTEVNNANLRQETTTNTVLRLLILAKVTRLA